MGRIRIVIGRTSGGIFWEGIERLLSAVPDFDVTAAPSDEALTTALADERPHVLLVQAHHRRWEAVPESVLKSHPGMAVIGLDLSGVDVILRLSDLGRDVLIRIIRAVCESTAHDQLAQTNILFLTGHEVKKLAFETASTGPISERYGTREHLRDFLCWLDLALLECLARDPSVGAERGTPGWTMGVQKARLLLGDHEFLTAEEIAAARIRHEAYVRERVRSNPSTCPGPKLIQIAEVFGLGDFEWLLLAVALAPEIDGRYARVFGFIHDDLTRKRASGSLLSRVLFQDDLAAWRVQRAIWGDGPLSHYRLLSVDPHEAAALPATEAGLTPASELVAYLLAGDDREPRYGPGITVLEATPDAEMAVEDAQTLELCHQLGRLAEEASTLPLMQLAGDEADRRWFTRAATASGFPVVEIDISALEDTSAGRLGEAVVGAARIAVLHRAILLVTGFARLPAGVGQEQLAVLAVANAWRLVPMLACHGRLSIYGLLAEDAAVWWIDRRRPRASVRAQVWSARARDQGLQIDAADAQGAAEVIGFDEPEIVAALRLCRGSIDRRDGPVALDALKAAARQVARQSIPPTVRSIETVFTWSDIVLPDIVLAQLREIPAHVARADDVLEDWGYKTRLPYGQGVAALFSGPSGTGKTMAAQIIARELGVELFQVDLAQTVSKYIGETEKNLDSIFEAAERSSAVLLFDEADAIFGKRTDLKDAHDRYANVECAYLLQRMEAYRGIAILTTNFKQNLDAGFLRRLRFFIEFPPPEARERELIWRRAFPSAAPLADDIDVGVLARRLAVTGGHIQQIALRAAFAAATERSPIVMRHVVQATRHELTKLGMLNAERSLAGLAA
ncbi:conserved hypothetical protein [uncultured Defluviicoccus sp.]|uniref:AAA+ ATPase domain-containing protein n=1 Tax=metagenome TaxID=256318 RepID=A0A380TB62_9ZZZZ|nr:conserved hypothetical protein [uncultured Defluviicoccus sp.]